MKKKILVLGAGLYFKKTIDKLKEGGFYVIAIDRDTEAPGKYSADEFYPVDITDTEATLKLCKEKGIDGVMNLNEFGSKTAAYVSKQLGLNQHSLSTVEATNDKGVMRKIWKDKGLSMPGFKVFLDKKEARFAAESIGFPCILKPADSGGSGRGISIIRTAEDAEWAYDFAKQYARNGRFIIEQFIDGVELTIESFSVDGVVNVLAISDKIKPDLRTRVATSLNYPAALSSSIIKKVKELTSKAVLALGISNGISHTEIIVDKSNTPFLIETAARGGGGHIFHTIIEAVSGLNAPLLQADWLVGNKIEINNIQQNGCCYRFFNPPYGILKSVKNVEEARKIEGVLDIGIAKKNGEVVGNLENSLHRAGFVVTCGKDRNEAITIADKVESLVQFEIEALHEN